MTLAAVLLVPGVRADSPVVGQVSFAEAPLVEGAGEVVAREGVLDLSEGTSRFHLRWSSATFDVRYRDNDTVDTGIPGQNVVSTRGSGGSVRLLPAGALNLTCGVGCQAFLIVEGRGELGAHATFSSPLSRLEAPKLYSVGFPPDQTTNLGQAEGGSQSGYWHSVEAGALAFGSPSPLGGTPLDAARPFATGEVLLVVERARIDLMLESGESESIDTNSRRVSNEDVDPVGTGRTYRTRTAFALVRLTNASLEAEPGTPFAFLAPSARIVADTTVSTESANGFVSIGGRRHAVEDESLRLGGALDLAFSQSGAASPEALPIGSFDARFTGDARVVEIGGVRVHDAPADAARNTAVVSGGVAFVLALLFVFKGSILSAFYSRIERSEVLDNENRRRVHALVMEGDGISIAEVCRELGLARAVAIHHLRLLEAHQFVVSTRQGRLRVFGVPGAAPTAQPSRKSALPTAGVRRRLAETIACTPGGLTQRELVDRTDVSQRLISYHLAKLEAAGHVVRTDDFPRKYQATGRLLSAQESAPQATSRAQS